MFTAKNIIFCSASNIKNYKYFSALKLDEYRGQVDWLYNKKNSFREVLSNDGYVIPDVNKKIIFDGSKPQQNFYLGFNLNSARGVCSSDMFVGDWAVIFEGTDFESLKFKVKNKIIPGMEDQYEPVC